MLTHSLRMIRRFAIGAAMGVACWAAGGCASDAPPTTAPSSPPPATRPVAMSNAPLGRAQLWAQTCNRCHNAWSPDQHSPAQWEIIMLHMRVRASLTAEEYRDILEFLKAQ